VNCPAQGPASSARSEEATEGSHRSAMRCYTGQDGHSGQLAGSPNKSPTNLLYDGLNRVRKTILPLDQASQRKEIVPTYNRAGALEKIDLDGTLYVRHIAYNAKGQRTLMAMGSGMMTRYAYDSVNFRLQRILSELYVESSGTYTPNGRVQQDLGYHYDLGGNIVGIRDKTPATLGAKGPGDLLKQFTYDPLKRLLTATGRESTQPAIVPSWDQNVRNHDHTATNTYTRAYEYDQVGNVLQEQHTATGNPSNNFTKTFSFALGKPHNRITRFIVNSTNYGHTYDACGNLLTENTNRHHQWGWNDSLRYFMNKVGMSAPTVWAHYLYDAGGNRVKKVVNKPGNIQEVTVYIDGVFEHSYVKRRSSIDVNKHYNTLHVMDARSRIATVRVGTDNDDSTPAVKYNVEDHLGTSSVTLASNGSMVNREEYYPFGETCFGAFAKKRYRYVGKEKDNETGLYYYGARYYAPWTCRFVSVDPLADRYAQLAPYNYAANNPIGDLDIDGMQATQTENSGGSRPAGQGLSDAEKREFGIPIRIGPPKSQGKPAASKIGPSRNTEHDAQPMQPRSITPPQAPLEPKVPREANTLSLPPPASKPSLAEGAAKALFRVWGAVNEMKETVMAFGVGFFSSLATNMFTLGHGRPDPNNYHTHQSSVWWGQLAGDVASIAVGAVEFASGLGSIVGGVALAFTGGGAVATAPAIAAGVAMIGHSVATAISAVKGITRLMMNGPPDDFDEDAPQQEPMGRPRGNSPRSNTSQNKQFNELASKYKLSEAEKRVLHDRISKEGLGYKEIEEIIKTEFKSNGRW
jgi:RHS repeat-associated protein